MTPPTQAPPRRPAARPGRQGATNPPARRTTPTSTRSSVRTAAPRTAPNRKKPSSSNPKRRSPQPTSRTTSRRPVERAPRRQVSAPKKAIDTIQPIGKRIRFLKIIVVCALAVMVLRLVDLQVLRHGQYQQDANQQLRSTITVPAIRGGIFDRNGAVLAMSVPTKEIIADDFQITQPVQEAIALAPLLGQSAVKVEAQLRRHTGYVVLATHVASTTASKIAHNHFPGITMVDTSKRFVPNGALGASVIGVTKEIKILAVRFWA